MYLDSGDKKAIIGSVDTPSTAINESILGEIVYIADVYGLVTVPLPTEIKPVTVL